MTTLLQEFEEWLKQQSKPDGEDWSVAMAMAWGKLQELKKKHNVPN